MPGVILFMALIVGIGLGVAYWNARIAGKIWLESKAVGGWIRVVAWCGAIQSAVAFALVYTVVVGIPLALYLKVKVEFFEYWMDWLAVFAVPALIGSSLIIAIESWRRWGRNRSLLNLGFAGWNTVSSVSSLDKDLSAIGEAVGRLFHVFSSSKPVSEANAVSTTENSSSGSDDAGKNDDSESEKSSGKGAALLALFLTIASIIAGGWTTYKIMQKYIGSDPLPFDEARFLG